MSGPVGTNEIEDFVSSVRRLVSVDARSRPVTRDLALDRLVLTPSLRVVPEAANDPLVLTVPAPEDVAPTGDAEVGEGGAGAEFPVAQAFDAEWEEEIWSEPEPPLSELALGAEEAEVVAETLSVEASIDQKDAPEPAPESASDGPTWPEIGQDWLDVGTVEDVAVTKPTVQAGGAAGATRPSVLELSAADMLTDGEGNPLTVLDEAALQQIIRQLIREELKGALGERITHSVRKLVRAEINRALAAHALD